MDILQVLEMRGSSVSMQRIENSIISHRYRGIFQEHSDSTMFLECKRLEGERYASYRAQPQYRRTERSPYQPKPGVIQLGAPPLAEEVARSGSCVLRASARASAAHAPVAAPVPRHDAAAETASRRVA